VRATPSGLAVVGVGLLDNLEANRILLTYLAIAFVFLFLSVRLRSIVRALLSLVPVLIAVGAASLFAYALDLKLSPMTAVGGPLVVAACTEFTSLILLRFVEERRRGLLPRAAVDVTARRTGRAFIVSALAAIAGVGVIALSSLPLLRDFGIIVALNVSVALLSALVVLPPLLIWADEKHHWVSKGLVPKDILERADNERDPVAVG
jgi:predicted RND superfamily exporter protein